MKKRDWSGLSDKLDYAAMIVGSIIGIVLGCIGLWYLVIKPIYIVVTQYTADLLKFVVICLFVREIYLIASHTFPTNDSDKEG